MPIIKPLDFGTDFSLEDSYTPQPVTPESIRCDRRHQIINSIFIPVRRARILKEVIDLYLDDTHPELNKKDDRRLFFLTLSFYNRRLKNIDLYSTKALTKWDDHNHDHDYYYRPLSYQSYVSTKPRSITYNINNPERLKKLCFILEDVTTDTDIECNTNGLDNVITTLTDVIIYYIKERIQGSDKDAVNNYRDDIKECLKNYVKAYQIFVKHITEELHIIENEKILDMMRTDIMGKVCYDYKHIIDSSLEDKIKYAFEDVATSQVKMLETVADIFVKTTGIKIKMPLEVIHYLKGLFLE